MRKQCLPKIKIFPIIFYYRELSNEKIHPHEVIAVSKVIIIFFAVATTAIILFGYLWFASYIIEHEGRDGEIIISLQ
jgi:hypothetical protein